MVKEKCLLKSFGSSAERDSSTFVIGRYLMSEDMQQNQKPNRTKGLGMLMMLNPPATGFLVILIP